MTITKNDVKQVLISSSYDLFKQQNKVEEILKTIEVKQIYNHVLNEYKLLNTFLQSLEEYTELWNEIPDPSGRGYHDTDTYWHPYYIKVLNKENLYKYIELCNIFIEENITFGNAQYAPLNKSDFKLKDKSEQNKSV